MKENGITLNLNSISFQAIFVDSSNRKMMTLELNGIILDRLNSYNFKVEFGFGLNRMEVAVESEVDTFLLDEFIFWEHAAESPPPIEEDSTPSAIGAPLSSTVSTLTSGLNMGGNSIILGAMVINIPMAVYMMKLFQFTSFLSLINITFPKNLEDFFSIFRLSIFDFLEFSPIDSEKLGCETLNRFKIEDMDCSVINNCWMAVI